MALLPHCGEKGTFYISFFFFQEEVCSAMALSRIHIGLSLPLLKRERGGAKLFSSEPQGDIFSSFPFCGLVRSRERNSPQKKEGEGEKTISQPSCGIEMPRKKGKLDQKKYEYKAFLWYKLDIDSNFRYSKFLIISLSRHLESPCDPGKHTLFPSLLFAVSARHRVKRDSFSLFSDCFLLPIWRSKKSGIFFLRGKRAKGKKEGEEKFPQQGGDTA